MNPFFIKYPKVFRLLYPNRITKFDEPKTLYLTFDDGPVPDITTWVLDELKKFHARATFFCVGDNIRKHPEIFERLVKEDHNIGNHTFNHLNGWKNKTDVYVDNVLKAEQTIIEAKKTYNEKSRTAENREKELLPPYYEIQTLCPGAETSNQKLFRPPFGKITNSQASVLVKLNYKVVMWDVISGDFENRISKEKCLKNVLNNASEGSTIVFHDSKKAFINLEYSLPKVLEYYSEKGFSFKSL